MTLSYDDRRKRYSGLTPDTFIPGQAKPTNATKIGNLRIEKAVRGPIRPGDSFRLTTAPLPPEPPKPPEPPPFVEPIPEDTDISAPSIMNARDDERELE
jgi:hypothetical protein